MSIKDKLEMIKLKDSIKYTPMFSVLHDNMIFITYLEIDNTGRIQKKHKLNDLVNSLKFMNKKYGQNKYVIRASLVDFNSHIELEALSGNGVVGFVIDNLDVLDTIVKNPITGSGFFHLWVEVKNINDLDRLIKYSHFIHGIVSKFSEGNVWEIISWKIISRLNIKIFAYGINCYKVRKNLCFWVDYMQGDLWPSIYHSIKVS